MIPLGHEQVLRQELKTHALLRRTPSLWAPTRGKLLGKLAGRTHVEAPSPQRVARFSQALAHRRGVSAREVVVGFPASPTEQYSMLRQTCAAFRGAVLSRVRLSPHYLVRLLSRACAACPLAALVRSRTACTRSGLLGQRLALIWTRAPSPTACCPSSRTSTRWTPARCERRARVPVGWKT